MHNGRPETDVPKAIVDRVASILSKTVRIRDQSKPLICLIFFAFLPLVFVIAAAWSCPAQFAGKVGEIAGGIGQQGLRFVRRGVCCCSAVARGFLALPPPSLGVSSLDLGRSPCERPFFF
jgi:hypothetical protein